MDHHAQFEIRSYANVIGNEIVARWTPIAWQAFKDYRINSIELSSLDIEVLKLVIKNEKENAITKAAELGMIKIVDGKILLNREGAEFENKISKLGINAPWN
jgi:thymidylate synthase (FAD)